MSRAAARALLLWAHALLGPCLVHAPTSALAQDARPPPQVAPPQPKAAKAKRGPKPAADPDDAVLRQLEMLMLMDMLKDYELVYDTDQGAARKKP